MDLSIIIVNWNVKDLVKKCIESIIRETKRTTFEIFVVDNNSHDGSQEMLNEHKNTRTQEHKNNLRIILNRENAGFSRANNQALRDANGEFVLFLNPDTEILNGALDTLVEYMRKNPDVAAVTPMLVNADGSLQPNVKRHPTFLSQVLIMLKLHHVSTWSQTIEDYLAKDFDYSREAEVEQVMGASFLTRRDLMNKLGGWDEDYWLWWEDVQLCKDFSDRGWKMMYTPMAKILHHEGKSFAQWMHLNRQKRFNRGMLIYFKKNGKLWQVVVLYLLQPLSLLLAGLAQLVRVKPRTQSKLVSSE